jgi:hypothetical protein
LTLALASVAACTTTTSDDSSDNQTGSNDSGTTADQSTAPQDAAAKDGGSDASVSGNDASAEASPIIIEAGSASDAEPYVWKNAQIVGGGYVPSVVFNPKEKDLIYARTDMGGAYRWDPVNSVWIPLLDWVSMADWNMWGMESIATDPVDPDNFYVAAGSYTNDWTSMNGVMLRSSDRGNTFQQTPMPFKFGGNMTGRGMGERLAVDPNDNQVLYFGARSGNGLWRSLDQGVTWNQVTSFTHPGNYYADPTAPTDVIGVVWVQFDPTSSTAGSPCQTIYVGVADTNTAIYVSKDGGNTWNAVAGQPLSGLLPHHGVLAPNGILYITYSDTPGPFDGAVGDVWKYDTKASVWTVISPIQSDAGTKNIWFGYGGLGVDWQNPNRLVVAAVDMWWPDTQFWRSTNGGSSWTPIWTWGNYPSENQLFAIDASVAPWLGNGTGVPVTLPEYMPKLGWMLDDVKIDPFNSDRMFYGTGATLFGTTDLTHWDLFADAGVFNASSDPSVAPITVTPWAKGIEETSVLGLVSPPGSGATLLSVMGDIGGFRHTDLTQVPTVQFLSGGNWGTATGIDYAETNPNFVVRANSVATKNVPYSDSGTPEVESIDVSEDNGQTWTAATIFNQFATAGTVAVASDGSSIVWAPTVSIPTGYEGGTPTAPVSYSKDKGQTWQTSSGVPDQAFIASDRVNPKKFYAFAAGVVYASVDGGATFTAASDAGADGSASLMPSGTSGSLMIKAVPGVEGDVWLAGGTTTGAYGLWHSTDSAMTFQQLAKVDQADAVGFGMAAPGKTYPAIYVSAQVSGVRGLFRSIDTGTSWNRINDDQHQYADAVQALTGDPRIYGRVYLATNGRGIIYGDIGQ